MLEFTEPESPASPPPQREGRTATRVVIPGDCYNDVGIEQRERERGFLTSACVHCSVLLTSVEWRPRPQCCRRANAATYTPYERLGRTKAPQWTRANGEFQLWSGRR